MTIERRAAMWIAGGDTGISSETIWAVMMGVEKKGPFGPGYPRDPSDFGRCYRLLQAMPEWRERLPEVAAKHPIWGPMVAAWDELDQMYEAALATGKDISPESRRMYDRMKALIDEGYEADGWTRTSASGWRKGPA